MQNQSHKVYAFISIYMDICRLLFGTCMLIGNLSILECFEAFLPSEKNQEAAAFGSFRNWFLLQMGCEKSIDFRNRKSDPGQFFTTPHSN